VAVPRLPDPEKPTGSDVLTADQGSLLTLAGDERWELVNRIASSPSFKKSPRLRQFLIFVAERSLTGHPEDVTEQNIGWRVFERKPDYNPSDDSIVRTAARQLRAKVKEYFDADGSSEDWILEIPKGHYSPIFTKKEDHTAPPPPIISTLAEPPRTASVAMRWQLITGALVLMAIVSSLFAYQLGRRSQAATVPVAPTIVSTVLSQSQEPTRVVVSDYGAILMSIGINRPVSVEEYANRSYSPTFSSEPSDPLLQKFWPHFRNGQMVPFSDVSVTGVIDRLSGELKKKIVIQHSRQVTARDLRSGNFILLNTPLASPWMNLFVDRLNFQYHIGTHGSQLAESEFVNTHPLPGEKARYEAAATTPNFGVTYGLVARLTNPTKIGKVLLIMGLRYTGGEAAGEFATDPEAAGELARLLKVKDINEAPDFEVLLETYSLESAPREVKIVAFRRH
jgi:hypothetical protein